MNRDLTVLYYTSNGENEYFESKVIEKLLLVVGDLPIVSVSQKPISLGRNICVGKKDSSYLNEFKQIQIGLNTIKTSWVIVAESDTIYPPEYFQFDPPKKVRCYRYNNVWVFYNLPPEASKRKKYSKECENPAFHYKGYSDCAQIMNREYWLKLISEKLKDFPMWSYKFSKKIIVSKNIQAKTNVDYSWGTSDNPVVTFKTGRGMRNNTATKRHESGIFYTHQLPHWGSAKNLREEMFKEIK
jgi:hypothetical protein